MIIRVRRTVDFGIEKEIKDVVKIGLNITSENDYYSILTKDGKIENRTYSIGKYVITVEDDVTVLQTNA